MDTDLLPTVIQTGQQVIGDPEPRLRELTDRIRVFAQTLKPEPPANDGR